MEYQAAPIDNPLKGLVPYADPEPDRFPHSLEFSYVKFSDLVVGPDRYNWKPLEQLLDDIQSRGNQTVFRVYLEYPGHKNAIPKFLINDGLKVTRWQNDEEATDGEKGWVETPDYENPKLRKALQQFIAALGEKYDGDPRVGYITAGLLGMWGEWHTYPREELWASKQTQNLVLDAYESAFTRTPILLRYPAGDDHDEQASNFQRAFGYHDDSFAYATLDTGKRKDDWFFQNNLNDSGAGDKWKTCPIGGEIRPEVWGCCFDEKPCTPKTQSFARCRAEMHVTWLMDSGMFESQADDARLKNAKQEVQKMGYEFFVKSAFIKTIGGNSILQIEVKNTGIAPFYHSGWTIHVRPNGDGGGNQIDTNLELTGIMPGEVKALEFTLPENFGNKIMVGVPNPMDGGKALRFANKNQNADQSFDQSEWLKVAQ